VKLHTPICPQCGKPAKGSSDFIPGTALFDGDPSEGPVQYYGETEVHWDGQFNASECATEDSAEASLRLLKDVPPVAQMQVVCPNGHEWITQFTQEDD
jgi:hypothetical protein